MWMQPLYNPPSFPNSWFFHVHSLLPLVTLTSQDKETGYLGTDGVDLRLCPVVSLGFLGKRLTVTPVMGIPRGMSRDICWPCRSSTSKAAVWVWSKPSTNTTEAGVGLLPSTEKEGFDAGSEAAFRSWLWTCGWDHVEHLGGASLCGFAQCRVLSCSHHHQRTCQCCLAGNGNGQHDLWFASISGVESRVLYVFWTEALLNMMQSLTHDLGAQSLILSVQDSGFPRQKSSRSNSKC